MIGKGGAVIRALTEETGCTIDIKDDGTVTIASVNAEACETARKRIEGITAEVEVGKIYEGPVLRLLDFGAIVQLLPGKDGLLHISQIAKERVNNVSDYVKEGQIVRVKVIEADEKGRVRLSMKAAAEEDAQTEACAAGRHRPRNRRRQTRRRWGSRSKRRRDAFASRFQRKRNGRRKGARFILSSPNPSVGPVGSRRFAVRELLDVVHGQRRVGRCSLLTKSKKYKRFIMLLQTLAWRPKTGWSAPWPAGMDSPSTLAVIFGGRASPETEAAVGESRRAAAQFHSRRMLDRRRDPRRAGAGREPVRCDRLLRSVTLRKVLLPIRDQVEAFAVGRDLGRALAAPDLRAVFVL